MPNRLLLKKRCETKEYINANREHTPMSLLLNSPALLLEKILGRPVKLSITLGTIFMGFFATIPTFATAILFGETYKIDWLGILIVIEGFCISNYIAYFNVNRFLQNIHDHVIDSVISISDLTDLKQWLSLGWTPKVLRYYLLVWAICLIPIGVVNLLLVNKGTQVYSLYVWILTFIILSGMTWSYAPLNMLLSIRLSKYKYSLNEVDPSHSKFIWLMSKSLNNYAYGYAINAALVQLIFASVSQFFLFGISAAIIAWVPLTIQFILNQISMRRIIVNSKWITLQTLQTKIKKVQDQDIGRKNNVELILKMMDLHDRIKGTPNSLLNIKALWNFSNQLAIPSLGFIIANIEKIMVFFNNIFV